MALSGWSKARPEETPLQQNLSTQRAHFTKKKNPEGKQRQFRLEANEEKSRSGLQILGVKFPNFTVNSLNSCIPEKSVLLAQWFCLCFSL